MEIMRKRTLSLCDFQSPQNIVTLDGGGVMHKHMQCHNNVDVHDVMSMQHKRKCNGLSSYLSQPDPSMEHNVGMLETYNLPPLTASMETVAMVTDSDATSCHSRNIPCYAIHGARHMTGGGDATNSVSLQPQNPVRNAKVCQRCLSGEPGHITHIVS